MKTRGSIRTSNIGTNGSEIQSPFETKADVLSI